MKYILHFIIGFLLVLYTIFSTLTFMDGLGLGTRCANVQPKRLYIIAPTYFLGCYLGAKTGQKWYYREDEQNDYTRTY